MTSYSNYPSPRARAVNQNETSRPLPFLAIYRIVGERGERTPSTSGFSGEHDFPITSARRHLPTGRSQTHLVQVRMAWAVYLSSPYLHAISIYLSPSAPAAKKTPVVACLSVLTNSSLVFSSDQLYFFFFNNPTSPERKLKS